MPHSGAVEEEKEDEEEEGGVRRHTYTVIVHIYEENFSRMRYLAERCVALERNGDGTRLEKGDFLRLVSLKKSA